MAVKVRHPGVGQAIARDFSLMMFVARAVSWLPGMRRLRLEDSLKQFAAPLTEQVRIDECVKPCVVLASGTTRCSVDIECAAPSASTCSQSLSECLPE